jgi:hypothetical protein
MWTFPSMMSTHPPPAELAGLQADLACRQVQRQAQLQHSLIDLYHRPGARAADQLMRALRDCAGSLLTLPFDLARAQHAAGVHIGALPRSLLESTRFEKQLVTMERLALGPLARRV